MEKTKASHVLQTITQSREANVSIEEKAWRTSPKSNGVFRSHKKPQHPNFPSHQNHIEILNIANNPCMEY